MENSYAGVFETLNKVDCSGHTEQKEIKDKTTGRVQARLTYLSWAWAWAEVKKKYPCATFKIYENEQGWNYHTDGRTAWVKTGVIIEGVEMIEYLPVMNGNNKSMPVDQITSFDVNKAIQRSLTKAAARHGLGLYIYAGEDLPEDTDEPAQKPQKAKTAQQPASAPKPAITPAKEPEQAHFTFDDNYDSLCADLDAAESVQQCRATATMAIGQTYEDNIRKKAAYKGFELAKSLDELKLAYDIIKDHEGWQAAQAEYVRIATEKGWAPKQ